jgi:hypothetical protein
MTPPTADRLAYLHTVVLHRCPEIGPADLASIGARFQPDDTLPTEIAEQILTVLDVLQDRLDELTAIVWSDDDDARQQRRA